MNPLFSKTTTFGLIVTAAALLTMAPSANASTWTINYMDTCTGSYCAGSYACFERTCIDSSIINMQFTCSEVCQVPGEAVCTQLPHACEAVGVLLQTPVGTCTYSYCDWQGAACVEVDTAHCFTPQAPAGCVGTLCGNKGLVCVWTQATPSGDCAKFVPRCMYGAVNTCFIDWAAPRLDAGACAGNPQSYDYTNPPCWGGIACVDLPNTKIAQMDFCFVTYTVM